MRHRRQSRRPISSINVVPYLDVLLVLLVIFMITTPLFSQGVIDLPEVGDTPLPAAEETALEVLYEQKADNPYRLKDHHDGDESAALSLQELIAELNKKKILYPKSYVIISAEGSLSYENVIQLLGALRDAGFENIALAAENARQ